MLRHCISQAPTVKKINPILNQPVSTGCEFILFPQLLAAKSARGVSSNPVQAPLVHTANLLPLLSGLAGAGPLALSWRRRAQPKSRSHCNAPRVAGRQVHPSICPSVPQHFLKSTLQGSKFLFVFKMQKPLEGPLTFKSMETFFFLREPRESYFMTSFNAELKGGFANVVGGKKISTDKSILWGC